MNISPEILYTTLRFLLNLPRKPGFLDIGYEVEALLMRSLRRPKQTVHPARTNKIREVNVSQKPAPFLKSVYTPFKTLGASNNNKNGPTWSRKGIFTGTRQFPHLVLHICVERDVDGECNESEHRSQE